MIYQGERQDHNRCTLGNLQRRILALRTINEYIVLGGASSEVLHVQIILEWKEPHTDYAIFRRQVTYQMLACCSHATQASSTFSLRYRESNTRQRSPESTDDSTMMGRTCAQGMFPSTFLLDMFSLRSINLVHSSHRARTSNCFHRVYQTRIHPVTAFEVYRPRAVYLRTPSRIPSGSTNITTPAEHSALIVSTPGY